jgi:DNA mismatch endonuclease (patch repair protein)
MGYRFRLHRKDLPGKPDIVLPKLKTVVLVHGCFWHRHQGCRFAYHPGSRQEFWQKKFARNVERDKEVRRELQYLGWRVLVIWECQTGSAEQLSRRIMKALRPRRARKSSEPCTKQVLPHG